MSFAARQLGTSVNKIVLTVTPNAASGSAYLSAPGYIFTNSVVASATGGSAYTYAWTYFSGDVFNITSPSSAATSFSHYCDFAESFMATYACTATETVTGSTDRVFILVSVVETH